MTIRDEIEGLVTAAAPQIGLPVVAIRAAGFLAIAGVVIFCFWRIFLADHQAKQSHDLAAAKAGQLVGQAQGAAGAHAANIIANGAERESRIHEITRDHYVEITRQPGAADSVSGPVWDAFVRSVCMRASAAGLPECQRLPAAVPEILEEGRQ